ncbi:tRNA pseudouridine(38-40) synthase TruA [Candidatus Omnitrophota bacterium]
MRNIKLTLEYDGREYCGWQRQKSPQPRLRKYRQKISIQEAIELCLKKILRQKVCLIASGRTDSGVHAVGQVANFKTTSKIKPDRLRLALNGNLPKEIRVSEAQEVSLSFHSRYSVKSKVYRYLILNQEYKSPFLKEYSYWFKQPLDARLMQKAAKGLLGKHDFKAFCASGSGVKDTKRTIKRIDISTLKFLSGNLITIEVEASGFLYNMMRNIAGTMIEIGRKRFAPDSIKKIISSRDRSLAGPCLPPKGLYLIEVKY